jgi:hypothetical protein
MVGNAEKAETAIDQNQTVNATFTKAKHETNICDDEGEELVGVRFHTNPGYLLVSLLSLGLYVPQNVTWWCHTEEPECPEGDQSEDCQSLKPEDF